MPINWKEEMRLRVRQLEKQKKIANKIGLKTLTKEQIVKRRALLNKSKFKSEIWFKSLLKEHFNHSAKWILVCKNHCLLNLFFVDFLFFKKRIIVEIDGKIHEQKRKYDNWRDSKLTQAGYKIYRINAFDEEAAMLVIKELIKEYRDYNF